MLAAIGAFVLALLILLFRGGDAYTVKVRFANASQVVDGAVVQVAGRDVGTVQDIDLTADGLAELELKISDDEITPFHRGTRARIRAVGLASVANRFIDLSLGPERLPEIEDGGVLDIDATQGIVDLDAVLDELDPPTRELLQGIIKDGSKIYAGSTEQANLAFHYLNPALSQVAALSRELVRDQAALERLVSTGADVSTALASRRDDLEQGVSSTAATLRAIAAERASLEDAVGRAPEVLRQGTGTLRRARRTLEVTRPALRDLSRAAPPLADVLRNLVPAARRATPVIADLRDLLPSVARTLRPLPALAGRAVPALGSATSAIRDLTPILAGLRPYTPDLVTGLFNGFGGAAGGYYDANGHFVRIAPVGGSAGLTDLLSLLGGVPVSPTGTPRTGITARCPGAAVETHPDGSNPFVPSEVSFCNRSHDR